MNLDQLKLELNRIEQEFNDLKEKFNSEIKNGPLIITPYFKYTIHHLTKNNSIRIVASFIIKNDGTAPLTKPYICLKLSPHNDISFSAKIKTDRIIDTYSLMGEDWTYLHDEAKHEAQETGTYWLKPSTIDALQSNEYISLFNFQITMPVTHSIKVEGFIYGDELEDGLQSLNTIRYHSN